MYEYEEAYRAAIGTVESSISATLSEMGTPAYINAEFPVESESTLDGWDYCYALAIGLAGAVISTNEALAQYLDEIHKAASGAGGEFDVFQAFLGSLLHHEGDYIDMIERPFKNRKGGNAYCIFHRLLWGHDILSIDNDNPFALMYKQQGIRGILQAVRHLLADTTSKQGLPLPGSSFLDVYSEDNKTSNYLIQIAQQLSNETFDNKLMAQELYSHMMTIRAQDVSAGVVVKLMSELYFRARKHTDKIRCTEIRLIAYTVNFLGEAIIGCVRQNGVPYINVPLGTAMVTAFGSFCVVNARDIRRLTKETETVHTQAEDLIRHDHEADSFLLRQSQAIEVLHALDQADRNADTLLDYFGGESE
jgi:hypothetical protein